MKLGEQIKKARIDSVLNRRHLGDMIGVSSEYIRLIEQGKRTPSYLTLSKIEQALNIVLDKGAARQFSGRGYSYSYSNDRAFEELASKLTNIERNYVVGYMEALIDRRKN